MNARVSLEFLARFDVDLAAIADRDAQSIKDEQRAQIARGISNLISHPWLARDGVWGAERLSFAQLVTSALRREERLGPDRSKWPLAFAQLLAAVREPEFAEAWKAYRERIASC